MNLSNKLEMTGEITYISELKKGAKTDFIHGYIQSYKLDGTKKFGFCSLNFFAYGKDAVAIAKLSLSKGDVITFFGSIRSKLDTKDNSVTTQFVVDRFEFGERATKQEEKKQEQKKEEYHSFNIVEDDLPF